jgi:integron integrase
MTSGVTYLPVAASRRLLRETSPAPGSSPRLLDRVRQTIRARHGSRRTEKAYVAWIRRFILYHGKRHPLEMGAAEVTQFLSALVIERNVAASTQNQALSAILFLYRDVLEQELPWLDDIVRSKRSVRLPVVLTREEVRAVLRRMDGVTRLMAMLLYGAGLRLLERARLRIKDVDFARNHITVRAGKGDKDRVTMLPAALKDALSRHLEAVRRQHEADLQHGAGWVELPWALARKYPNAGREWPWQWVFPATGSTSTARAASAAGIISTSPFSSGPSSRPSEPRVSQSARPRTLFAIPLRHTSWKIATTSAPCKSFSAIAA